MSQPFKLYRLQQIDTATDHALLRLRKIQAVLTDDSALRQIQEQIDALDQSLDKERKKLRRMEEEVQTQAIKVGQTEASLYGGKVHNPKELQDLEKESASIRRHINSLEENQLEQMLIVEEIETEHAKITAILEEARDKKATQDALLRAEQANLEKDLLRIENERNAAITGIDEGDLKIYEQLRQTRKGLAVATVVEGTCSACGSTMTPAVAQSAQSSVQLARCSFCGRILYVG